MSHIRPPAGRLPRALRATVAALAVAVLAACQQDSSGTGRQAGPSEQECARIAEISVDKASPATVLVVDNTASAAQSALPPAIETELAGAQKSGHQLAIVAVDGAGHKPSVVRRVMLDPSPGKDSSAADNARVIALGCVATWIRGEEALPQAPGSDILAAISAGSRERPKKILVISDGLANDGDLNLSRDGFDVDPAALADSLRRTNALDANLNGVDVVWTNLAESTAKIPQPVRASLQDLWTFVLTEAGAKVTFDTRTANAGEPVGDLPDDDVSIPEIHREALPSGCGTEYVVPAALLFSPDSAVLQPGTDAVLRTVADEIGPHADWTATVSGHTANYGTAGGRMRLSVQRAEAVAAALVRLGVAQSRLSTHGYGSTEPAVSEFRNGVHDTAAAARNRRVVIEVSATGCVR